MSTKNNPGKYDCYANAAPDEPMFVLLGRDPSAAILVRLWATIREMQGEDADKVAEARLCADAMTTYALKLDKGREILNVVQAVKVVVKTDFA